MQKFNLVWSEGLTVAQTDELREQVERALESGGPNTLVTNFKVHWAEMEIDEILPVKAANYDPR